VPPGLAWSAYGLAFMLAGLAVSLGILNGLDARTLFSDHLPGLSLDARNIPEPSCASRHHSLENPAKN
jgi:hypothetical protein